MTKAELKTNWGKYCDTDKLVDDLCGLLLARGIRHTVEGTCDMLNVFFTNKEDIIKMMRNSDNYIGNLRIKVDTSMRRYNNMNTICRFVDTFCRNVESEKILHKHSDANGKTLNDYVKIGRKKVTIDDIVSGKMNDVNLTSWKTVFTNAGITHDSILKERAFRNVINCFYRHSSPIVSEDLHDKLYEANKEIKIAEGTKTSRAFNKVCHLYGIDSVAQGIGVKIASGAKFADESDIPDGSTDKVWSVKNIDGDNVTLIGMKKAINKKYLSNVKYNKLFAEYSDMVTDTKRNIKFYISVNPIDYITMSVGRSWSSCHGFGSGYFGGTASYMLDNVSIITFVHDEEPDDFVNVGKIYRNMFHYKNGILLQSRVYPQGNDGCTDLYEEFRKIVQKEIADMLGRTNSWNKYNKAQLMIESIGNHYRDYNYSYNGVNLSKLDNSMGCRTMIIGHAAVCPYCGNEDATIVRNRIAHTYC